jgi:RNA polymerase sigma-70 factor (ECF subfamily)
MIEERPDYDLAQLADRAASSALPQSELVDRLEAGTQLEISTWIPVDAKAGVGAAALAAEAEMIRRICAGEKELFIDLVKPYQKMVYGMAVSIVKNDHDAEEIAQEALFKAFKNLSQFRGDAKFSTWIVQIAMNEARQCLRRQKRAAEQSLECGTENEEGEHKPIDFADWREIPSEALQRKELRRVLNDAISSLRPIYRDVLELRDVQHFSVAETAQLLSISEASVKTRLMRARFQVRDALAPGFDGYWNTGNSGYKRVRPF